MFDGESMSIVTMSGEALPSPDELLPWLMAFGGSGRAGLSFSSDSFSSFKLGQSLVKEFKDDFFNRSSSALIALFL